MERTKQQKMTVEVWSDIMCPFCSLGKRRFANALAEFEHRDDVELIWKSFQLMPSLHTDPTLRIHDFLAREKGWDVREAKQMNEQLAKKAAAEGLVFNFEQAVVANTFRAHRLLHYAREQGRQDEAMERVFRAYFAEGGNVDDHATLVELGAAIGLDPEAVSAVLESDRYADEVRGDIEEARQLGVRGVPFFVFDRKYAVSGAQDSAAFLQALERAFGEWSETRRQPLEISEGETCAVDGVCR